MYYKCSVKIIIIIIIDDKFFFNIIYLYMCPQKFCVLLSIQMETRSVSQSLTIHININKS